MAYVRQHPNYPRFRMKLGVMPDFSGSIHVSQEEPIGAINGTNKVFVLRNIPLKNSETVIKDGMTMIRNLDYTIDSDGVITFSDNQIPQPDSVLRVSYDCMKTS